MMGVNAISIYALLFASLYFEVFLLITFFEWREKEQAEQRERVRRMPNNALPSVTIAVPCFNENTTIEKTLYSLLALDYPKEKLSIVAIDDGSTDGTFETLTHFTRHPQIRVMRKENGGKHTALNVALQNVTTDLFGCLDADSFVEKNALLEIVRYFEDSHVSAVTPAIKVYKADNLISLLQRAEYTLSIFIRRTFSHMNALFITPGPFSLFRVSIFETLGPYRAAHHTEDLEIALRMHAHGMRIENAHRAIVYTHVPKTFGALFRQRLRWSYGFLKNIFEYRFLFFKPRYGILGMCILPLTILSFVSALYFFSILLFSAGMRIVAKIAEVKVIGLASLMPNAFDWFFVNTQPLLFLSIIIVGLTIILIAIGKKLLQEKRLFSLDLVCYFAFYWLIAPLWLSKALYCVIVGKKTSWR